MRNRIRKVFHICLMAALLLTAAAGSGWAETEGEFVVTGYTASRSKITKGKEVDIQLHLKHTGQITEAGLYADISRLVDSFSGGDLDYQVTSAEGSPLELDVSVQNLKYTGSGQSLKLMISAGGTYEQLEVPITECEEYEEPVYEPSIPEDPDPIPEPVAIMSRNEMENPLKAGEKSLITIYVTNTGNSVMESPVISFTPSEGLFLPGTASALQMEDIRGGKTEAVQIEVQALNDVSAINQYLDLELRFQYYNYVSTVEGSSTGRVTVPVKIKKETEPEPEENPIDSPVPNLIITSFHYGGNSVAAGSEFGLQFQFVNTSSSLPVENVVVTLEGGDGFTIHGASNTVYFEKIKAGGSQSVSVPMKVMPDVKNGAKPVSISFKYEYVDNNKRIPVSSDMTITVPVYQPDRFEISYPELPVMVYTGDEISVMLNYVNKSKTDILNVEARLEGEVETYTPVQNLGNMEPGKSGTIAFAVTAWEPGDAEFTISVAYEDGNGQTQTREFPLTLTVEEMVMEDPGMYEPMPEPEPEPQTNWKLIGALAAAAVLVLVVLIRKKKKAAALKKETEMWSSWDDDGDAAAMTSDSTAKQEAEK